MDFHPRKKRLGFLVNQNTHSKKCSILTILLKQMKIKKYKKAFKSIEVLKVVIKDKTLLFLRLTGSNNFRM